MVWKMDGWMENKQFKVIPTRGVIHETQTEHVKYSLNHYFVNYHKNRFTNNLYIYFVTIHEWFHKKKYLHTMTHYVRIECFMNNSVSIWKNINPIK